jgi:hypothetical protein
LGYDVHITRAEEWSQNEGREIRLSDWLTVVREDPELELAGAAEAVAASGETLRYEDESLAKWKAHPDAKEIWFRLAGGNVVAKNPDPLVITKMKQLAVPLKGQVQGDEGEQY